MKYDIMSRSHRIAKDLLFYGNRSSYKKRLSLALKVEHLRKRLITVLDINWLMENYPQVNLSLIKRLHKYDSFIITVGYYLSVEHYVEPKNEEQINYGIGVMIESEKRSRNKITLD